MAKVTQTKRTTRTRKLVKRAKNVTPNKRRTKKVRLQ